MKHVSWALLTIVLAVDGVSALEKVADSRMASVALFKNGLAVVTHEVRLDGAGTFLVSDPPSPVHGTFWVDADSEIEVRMAMRNVSLPQAANPVGDFQQQLAGRTVTVHFNKERVPSITGKILPTKAPGGDAAWDRQYQQSRNYGYGGGIQPDRRAGFSFWRPIVAPSTSTPPPLPALQSTTGLGTSSNASPSCS